MAHPYKTVPFPHQQKALRLSAHMREFALFIRPGYGKSKIIADTAADLWLSKKIDAMVVTAPNIVHENWLDQLETHMPQVAFDETTIYIWHAAEATKTAAKCKAWGIDPMWEVMIREEPFPVLLMNIDAVLTPLGYTVLSAFLKRRKCLFVEDESSDIATPGAKRTKRMRALARYAHYRRILDGNPTDEKPLHLYAPMAFLNPKIIGCSTHEAFKLKYAEWDEIELPGCPRPVRILKKVYGPDGLAPVYKNLDDLAARVGKYAYVMTDADAAIGMPPRTYGEFWVDLTARQREMYRDLQQTDVATFEEDGATVSAANALVRDLRLQQIVQGYVPVDPGWMWKQGEFDPDAAAEPTRIIDGGATPRLLALWEGLEKYPGKAIVWGRFRLDLDLISEMLGMKGVPYVRIDGTVPSDERFPLIDRFQNDKRCRVAMANGRVAGRGIELTKGLNVFFYSNYFSARLREQMERRAWRIGVEGPVLVTDILARRTIDEKIVRDVRVKRRISERLTNLIANVNA